MSNIVEDQAKNLAVDQLGFSEKDFQLAWNAGVLLGMLATGNIALAAFLDLASDPKKESIKKWLDEVLKKLAQIKQALDVAAYNDRYQYVVEDNATKIDKARAPMSTFLYDPGVESRNAVIKAKDDLQTAMLGLLDPGFPFSAMVYSGPDWADGRFTYFRNYVSKTLGWPGWYKFQVYQQIGVALGTEWALPESLQTETLPPGQWRWDGLPSLPVVLRGLPVWQGALILLEPFYRLSGHWKADIEDVVNAMVRFEIEWAKSVVWTREMPSLSTITKHGYLHGGEVGGGAYDPSNFPQVGFYDWPCAVLDPVMGIEIINKDRPWWTCNGWKTGHYTLEMMTDMQRAQFKQLRQLQHLTLDDENGFNKFKDVTISVGNLRKPPTVSPSLEVHPEHLRVTRPGSSDTVVAIPKHENVTDPAGKVWNGIVARSSVTVTAPVSVQPNPAPGAPPGDPLPPRRAVSDIVFGYKITVTAVGGNNAEKNTTFADWQWPLSHPKFFPPATFQDKDLYHSKDGTIHKVPYFRPHEFTLTASTWKTVTDGELRDKIDELTGQKIAIRLTVAVYDQAYHLLPVAAFPLSASDPDQILWRSQHGVILVTIEADMDENNGRSFELMIEISETAAVDKDGRRVGEAGFAGAKTYTLQMPMPVDIYKINVPTGYFSWIRQLLERLRHVSTLMDVPHPEPDPDPVLELSLWRIVLEKNPAFLQAHVHELRRATGRPFLMPQQALAELDAAVNKLTGIKQRGRETRDLHELTPS